MFMTVGSTVAVYQYLQKTRWRHGQSGFCGGREQTAEFAVDFSIDLPPRGEKKAVVSSAAEIMSYQNETVSLYKYLYIE